MEVPAPKCPEHGLLIRARRSAVSPGTERTLVEFSRGGLLHKARSQPERVREVLAKIRTDGLMPTMEAVFAKLNEPMPLGYCCAGVVIDQGGEELRRRFPTGTRVATNAPHAEFAAVGPMLAARIPDGVSDDAAAFTPLAAIALQGIRLAAPTLGERVFVIGTGLVGLLAVQLLRANGCRVLAFDPDAKRLELARLFGAEPADPATEENVDAVLICAATSSQEPIRQAAAMCRPRGRIVLVGVAGLEIDRTPFFRKELGFSVSCSYGPGRYDEDYEERGRDYPIGHVRWTEHRNFEAVLALMESGALDLAPLISRRLPIAEAERAYSESLNDGSLGILLEYDESEAPPRHTIRQANRGSGSQPDDGIGVIGTGSFARRVLLPLLKKEGARVVILASRRGVSAALAGRQSNAAATTDPGEVLRHPGVGTVVIATRHADHAALTCEALAAGKNVFVEKPLALTLSELRAVRDAATGAKGLLHVGYNRRFAPTIRTMREKLGSASGVAFDYVVNAGTLPQGHWAADIAAGGGRLVGEACHFADTLRWVAGAPCDSVYAISARDGAGKPVEDRVTIQLGFRNGSIGTIQYWSGGPKTLAKERLLAIGGGAAVELENFRRLTVHRGGKVERANSAQDKGHRAEVRAFLGAVARGGEAPIPLEELLEVSLVTLAAIESLRTGEAQRMATWWKALDA